MILRDFRIQRSRSPESVLLPALCAFSAMACACAESPAADAAAPCEAGSAACAGDGARVRAAAAAPAAHSPDTENLRIRAVRAAGVRNWADVRMEALLAKGSGTPRSCGDRTCAARSVCTDRAARRPPRNGCSRGLDPWLAARRGKGNGRHYYTSP